MRLLALGINHKTASLDIREKVAIPPDQIVEALAHLQQQSGFAEVVILNTCNRTELFCVCLQGGDDDSSYQRILHWLSSYHHLDHSSLQSCSYHYYDQQAVQHMMQVACGLDSMVLGEPQIFGQMKTAFADAQRAKAVGAHLHRVFQQVFSIAKRVRTETAIGENPVSVAYAAVSLAQRIFADLSRSRALLIGAGETIELVARHLAENGVKKLVVANRTLSRGQELAEQFGAEAVLLTDIADQLPKVDIVISSTASPLPVLGKGMAERAMRKRKHRPIFMVDIAVPRDIEPEVGDLEDVYLYSVDDLQEVINENMQSRAIAADEAKQIIVEGVELYLRDVRAQQAVGAVKAYRQVAEQTRDEELEKALKRLAAGDDAEKVMMQFARGLTNKLIHTPTTKIREAGAQGRTDLVAWAVELLDLADVSGK